MKTVLLNLYSCKKGFFTLENKDNNLYKLLLEYSKDGDILILFSIIDCKVFDEILVKYPQYKITKMVYIQEEIFCVIYDGNKFKFSDFLLVTEESGSLDKRGRRVVHFEMIEPINTFITMAHCFYETTKALKSELEKDIENYHKDSIIFITHDPLL